MKYTKEEYENKINKMFPDESITLLEFKGVTHPAKLQCNTCGTIREVKEARKFANPANLRICHICKPGKMNIKSRYKKELEDILKDSDILLLDKNISYSASEVLTFHCTQCGMNWNRELRVFIKTQSCPKCDSINRKKEPEIYRRQVEDIHGDEYKILEDYRDAYSRIKVQHTCGFIFSIKARQLLGADFCHCPKCSKRGSVGEKKILEYLEKKKIRYNREYIFDGLPIKRFDFFLPDFNTCIEFQGIQHSKYVEFFHRGDINNFYSQQERDKEKVLYCEKNNIKLILIQYNEIDKINSILNSKFND